MSYDVFEELPSSVHVLGNTFRLKKQRYSQHQCEDNLRKLPETKHFVSMVHIKNKCNSLATDVKCFYLANF